MVTVLLNRSVAVRALAVLPLAVLLLAGCGDDGDTAGQLGQLNDSAQDLNDAAQDLEDAADNLPTLDGVEESLRDAAQNLGDEGVANVACTSVRTVVNSSEGGDTEAAATQLAATVATIFTTVGGGEGDFDLDAAMVQECPAVHDEALEITGKDTLNELYRN